MAIDTGLQIIDVNWKRNLGKDDSFYPNIKLYNKNEKQVQNIELINYNIKWKLSNYRKCVGYSENDNYVTCKFNNYITDSRYERCAFCEDKDGFRSAFLFRNEPNERMQEYLSRPQQIYLAFFEPDLIKVGTASIKRNRLRLIEQDAQAYCFIAEAPDGITVQNIEREISKKLNIPEIIRSIHKKKFIYQKSSFQSKSEKLKEISMKVIRAMKNTEYSSSFYEQNNIEIINNSELFFYPENKLEFIDISKYEYNLSGTFLGLRGNYLILKNLNNTISVNKKDLIGREIIEYTDNYEYLLGHDSPISLFG